LACPGEAVDTLTRWAGALAFGAAGSCAPEEIAEFLRTYGIREAADGWTDLRRSRNGNDRPKPAKPHPFDLMRSTLRAFAMTDDPSFANVGDGPFLIIAERLGDGRLVGYASFREERLVLMAAKAVIAAAKAAAKNPDAR